MNIDLLKRLCETPGVPGHEHHVRDLIMKEAKGLFDTMEIDHMGNLLCHRKGKKGAPKVMMACHMDEIGFLVSHITDKGFIYVLPVGGFDPRNMFSRRVKVCTDSGEYRGVMNPGGRPIHISSPEERKKVPEVAEFVIDLGLGDKTKDLIKLGDMVVWDEPFMELGDTRIVSKALDNRIACWLGLESVRGLAKKDNGADIYVAFTVQEEVGLRGARTAAFQVNPDIGIGIDVTLACDTPGVPEQDRTTQLGEGFGLHIRDGSFISDRELVADFAALAEKKKIPYQRTLLRSGGQDGAALQQAAAGARAVGIVVGTRYIHTVTEMIDRRDLEAARNILTAYLKSF